MFAGTEDGIEEDAAKSDLGTPFVTEGIIDHDPDLGAGNKLPEEFDQEDTREFVPVPHGLIEEAIERGMIVFVSQASGLPDAGDGASPEADDPGSNDETECFVNRFVETGGERG